MRIRLKRYFDALKNSYPYDSLGSVYYTYIESLSEADSNPEGFDDEVDSLIMPVLNTYRTFLNEVALVAGYTAYISASDEIRTYFKAPSMIKPYEDAITYAEKNAADLIKGLDKVTKDQIKKVIVDGLKNKSTLQEVEKAIMNEFADMSKTRAELIARTELAKALETGGFNEAKALGLQEKSTVLGPNPCDICIGNASQGWIDIDSSFADGGAFPPFHPRCVCCTIFRYKR